MNYDEALLILKTGGEYSKNKKRVIVPLTKEYFEKFNKDLHYKILKSDDVKTYALDNKFTIWEYDLNYIKGERFNI